MELVAAALSNPRRSQRIYNDGINDFERFSPGIQSSSPQRDTSTSRRAFWISPPYLSPEDKRQYRTLKRPRISKQEDILEGSEEGYDPQTSSSPQTLLTDESGDEDDFRGLTPRPMRRSARNVALRSKINHRDTSESTRLDGDDTSDDDPEISPKHKRSKPENEGKVSRGSTCHDSDLSETDSDDDISPFKAHRSTCERCYEAPAHELLAKYYKRRKKGKKFKKGSDLVGEEEEEGRLLALGGWVQCLKCCVATHWKCLTATQRDEIVKSTRSKDKDAEVANRIMQKRVGLDPHETMEFICGSCIADGMCMFCRQGAAYTPDIPEKADGEESMVHPDVDSSDGIPTPAILVTVPTPPKGGPAVVAENVQTPKDGPAVVAENLQTPKDGPAVVAENLQTPKDDPTVVVGNVQASKDGPAVVAENVQAATLAGTTSEKLFRCGRCKRSAHYSHLPQPIADETLTSIDLARYYQTENDWQCSDCVSFVDDLDKILAWRPYPADAVEPPRPAGTVAKYNAYLPREYLVKWATKSYRHLNWVPHMWLLSTSASKLKNFIAAGPKIQLLDTPAAEPAATGKEASTTGNLTKELTPSFLTTGGNSRESSVHPVSNEEGPSSALPDAEGRIPLPFLTVDRILEVLLWNPTGRKSKLQRRKVKNRPRNHGESNGELAREHEPNSEDEAEAERILARQTGKMPHEDYLETLDEWEARTGTSLTLEHAELVIWAFVKWDDLPHEEATWDSPPGPSDVGWAAFVRGFEQFLYSRKVLVARKNKKEALEFDARPKALFDKKSLTLDVDPVLGQDENLKLMDFQLTGVNWLFRNWWRHQPSILADDMGLGKTVQIVCLVGHLVSSYQTFPVLIVVPNSTITNWLREFARWAPRVRAVQYNGDAKSREVIRDYELYHDVVPQGYLNLKFHVLVTTYETIIGKDFRTVFKPVPRWELLVVDEGQRLKNNSSLLFRKLNELKTIHRILLTGTPLNNKIRELFNLMNFLDPENWNDLDGLEEKYSTLTEALLDELHETLKPYFLRRTKADVLKLPPKNEVIVPVSMTAIQKEVYKSLLSQNAEILGTLAQPSSGVNGKAMSNLNNLLMQLRKCLQHPYLISRDLEPSGPTLTPSDVHQNLIDASAKLRLLHTILPKLKARGHRLLLFSQFTIALDIIEDFVVGEGYNFLRLDGTTKQAQRQKDMDAFNRSNSDIFIYLLSTRAGGVGVNLWSADTVIIFDPDFNPHQDLQAISRAHRYGQEKPVLVFKLMVRGAAEERIVQAGKKKLALDHLIVQKMDDDGAIDDVQSILTFGAKAVFEGSDSHDINYTDADIDNLITRTEQEGEKMPEASSSQSSFGFAKLYVVEKDAMEEIEEGALEAENDGFWSSVLARAAAEKEKAKAEEVTGRGAKRRAAVSQRYNYEILDDDDPSFMPKSKKRKKSNKDDDVEYRAPVSDGEVGNSGQSTTEVGLSGDDRKVINDIPETFNPRPENHKRREGSIDLDNENYCGLCHTSHGPGLCYMTESAQNLVKYRLMLMNESEEPISLRHKAIFAIDERLASRGLSHLIKGQATILRTDNLSSQGKLRRLDRSSSPSNSASSRHSKAKKKNKMICQICRGSFHLVKSCPVVKRGPDSIKAAISRLEKEPNATVTVNILRSFLHVFRHNGSSSNSSPSAHHPQVSYFMTQ